MEARHDDAPTAEKAGSGRQDSRRHKQAVARNCSTAADVERAFLEALAEHGLAPADGELIPADGTLHRYRVDGDRPGRRNGWAVLHLDGVPAGAAGSWRTGESFSWSAREAASLTEAERAEQRERVTAARAEAERRREAAAARAAQRARRILDACPAASQSNAYVLAKGIPPPPGPRENRRGALLVPMYSVVTGALVGIQVIEGDGAKRFLAGTRKAGAAFPIPSADGDRTGPVIVAEGVATAATVAAATGYQAVAAFDAGNLAPVARAIRDKYANRTILIAADRDGEDGGVGVEKARAAAEAVAGRCVIPPVPGDWNDHARERGADAVHAAFERVATNAESSTGKNRFGLVAVSDLELRSPRWLVRDLMEADALALIFGDPGSMKSFLAIDWSCRIATGTDFHGRSVEQGPVIYIAGEGHNGLVRRFRAWSIRYGVPLEGAPLYVSTTAASLSDEVSTLEVGSAIDGIAREHGIDPALIVVDTLARNFGPGDENATQDMGQFISAADELRSRYNATVLLVHHTGHHNKERARGAMALLGALDAEYRIDKDESAVVRLTSTKMKDAPTPEPLAFRAATVELGVADDEGRPVTSAVLDLTSYEPPARSGKSGRGKWQTLALEQLNRLYGQHRENVAADSRDPDTARVSLQVWRDACIDAGMRRQTFHDVKNSLAEQGLVTIERGFVWPR